MHKKIEIRNAVENDFPSIIGLIKEFATFQKSPEKMINSFEKMTKEKEFFHCFVAVSGKKEIIGYVTYFFCYYTWTGKSLNMDDLYVKPEYRSKGIGTQLLNKVIAYAKAAECHQLRWQVSGWNKPAIEFYKNIGAELNHLELNCVLMLVPTNSANEGL